jgi:hypothetical protein
MPVLSNTTLPGNSISGNPSFGAQLSQVAESSLLGAVGLSQASGRMNVADMFKYSTRTVGPAPRFIYPDANTDWRVRVSLAPNSKYFYNDPSNTLLAPLVSETGGGSDNGIGGALGNLFGVGGAKRVGVVFPYTPSVTVQHNANYSEQKLTHSNYTQYFYDNSEVSAISITADFTVQNVNEGQYLLATVYFFRSVTKMFFGMDPGAGNPPPLVYLNGYGQYYLPNVPCVVKSFSHTMPEGVDYMDIPEPSVTRTGYNPQIMNRRLNSTRMPTTSQITLSLQPVYSRTAQSSGFSLEDFARGALVNRLGAAGPASAFGATQGIRYADNNIKNGGFI